MNAPKLICLASLFAVMLLAPCVTDAGPLDLSRSEDVIRAEMRLACSPDPARPHLTWMTGQVIARRAGEADRKLFRVQGINTRACASLSDPKRGLGYRSVTREVIFYLDPDSGALLESWRNPWTGETIPVVHMFNDPVNMAEPRYSIDAAGEPVRWPGRIVNGLAVLERVNSHFRDSPLGGNYQAWVGGKYRVVEISTTTIPVEAWLSARAPSPVPIVSAWTRISPWLPWMKMGDREGQTILSATWTAAKSIDELPQPLRDLLRTRYPLFATAPPLDDPRPSVSSWDGIKRALDAETTREN